MKEEKISRRHFFRKGFASFVKTAQETASAFYLTQDSSDERRGGVIRPPGALAEERFLQKCTRCDACVKACPEQSIRKVIKEGAAEHLTPTLNLRLSPCILCEDFPCVDSCEDEALLWPESREKVRMGTATVVPERCFAWQGQYCDACLKACPFPEKAIKMDEICRPRVDPSFCTGCGLCEHRCPSRPSAIVVKRLQV